MSELEIHIRKWAQENVSHSSLEQAEQQIEEAARQMKQMMVEETAKAMEKQHTYEGSAIHCECGANARFMGYRKRWIQTLCGEVAVSRAYYHCGVCGSGYLPWDIRQGLNQRLYSPGVKALACDLSARLHYSEASSIIEHLSGIKIEESSLEAIVGEVGKRLREGEKKRIAAVLSGEQEILTAKQPKRLYISLDGTMVHIDGGWHEVKTGAVYEGKPIGSGEHPDWDRKDGGLYTARRETSDEFGNRLYVLALQGGLATAEEVIVMGDGAVWIWNQASIHFKGSGKVYTEIVDYRHACEHIYDLAKVLYGETSAQGHRWAKGHCDTLETKGPDTFLKALKRRKIKNEEQREAIKTQQNYFQKNRERMNYPRFRARGLMIGSGPVEAACKVVVGQRCNHGGMRWSNEGVDAILAIRATALNGDREELKSMARAA